MRNLHKHKHVGSERKTSSTMKRQNEELDMKGACFNSWGQIGRSSLTKPEPDHWHCTAMDPDVVGEIEKPLADLNQTDYRCSAYSELNKALASYYYELIQSADTVLPRSD
jgi:hypothetical protein